MDDSRKIRLGKLDAAVRQMDTAIALWFQDGDEVSVHTLLAASYQVIFDVNKQRGTGHDSIYEGTVVKPEFRKAWQQTVKEASNFFKHADKDPEGQVEFFPISNIMFMLYGMTGLASLKVQSTPVQRILAIWLYLHEQRFLSPLGVKLFKGLVDVKEIEKIRPLPRQDFFQTLLKAAVDFHDPRSK